MQVRLFPIASIFLLKSLIDSAIRIERENLITLTTQSANTINAAL